ncbi:hypothetical protein N0V82_004713 [Gnomoniopsis sp. IMI 355080]|nr:hypothetical protein N0V82_004713 [Gnomoniopsis sp. IMI 355080]
MILGTYEMTPHKAPTLDEIFTSLLARRRSRGVLRDLTTSDKNLVDFSSNDYLSISRRPDVRQAYISQIQRLGELGVEGFSLGSGGSRLLDGNTELAESLERRLAEFHGAEAGLLFNSGYEANTGLLASAPQAGDVVIFDEAIHASVHSGIKLSRAGLSIPFAHNRVWKQADYLDHKDDSLQRTRLDVLSLEGTLERLLEGECGAAILAGQRHVFITVEALYSMDGDVAPLRDVVQCVEKYLRMGNGLVIVDEAHSNGIFGDRGQGLACQLGLESRIWASVLTFGKALGCAGGTSRAGCAFQILLVYAKLIFSMAVAIILCSQTTRAYLINYARTFIYTTAMGPPGLLSIQVAHEFVASGHADVLRSKLQGLIQHVHARLGSISRHHDPSATIVRLRAASLQSPIIPIFTSRAKSLARHCQSHGLMVRAIVAPTVPRGTDRLRICLHAGNTDGDCDKLCNAIEEWVSLQSILKEQGLPVSAHPIKNRL